MTTDPRPAVAQTLSPEAALERRVVRKIMWRIIPVMCFLYLFNYLDRVNIGYAKLQMPQTLPWLTASVFGFAAGIFFVGYFLFEVPSNLIMQKVGARLWMARIMVSWGLISAAMAFISEPWHFHGLRLLLGFAEAGFFPGMLLYITYWIPAQQRANATALFMTSTALSGVIGGPIAEALMQVHGFGLVGWQWMFLLEGIPSVLLGISIIFVLSDSPLQARWLTAEEKRVLAARLEADHAAMPHDTGHHLSDAMRDPRVWVLCLLYGLLIWGFYVINFWTPSLIESTHPTSLPVGWLSAIPFLSSVIVMSLVGMWTDATGRRRHAVIIFATLSAIGFAIAALTTHIHSTALMVISLSIAAASIWSTLGPFWALPSRFLRSSAVAGGLALINAVGNLLGGTIGNGLMGKLKDATGTYEPALWITAGIALGGALLAWQLTRFGLRDVLTRKNA
jgi:ACS family tartrate transporter-like MFS transporter